MLFVTLGGCGGPARITADPSSAEASGGIATVAFDAGGRLWRVRATAERIYVDHSTDLGASYSPAVAVNDKPQHIRAMPEDRPGIALDRQGRITVIYYAAERHGAVPYYSYSEDNGAHFSPPRALGAAREGYEHAMVKLISDPLGRLYLFWYETTPRATSAYYTVADSAAALGVPDIKIADSMCECCRLAVDFNRAGEALALARVIFPGSIRDHALIEVGRGTGGSRRVTYDEWRIEACPRHGPAISIDHDGRYHIAWFTQGAKRQGLFYAYSTDRGAQFSEPVRIGRPGAMAEHADVLALDNRAALVWKEFDGQKTQLLAMQSADSGVHWSAPARLAESASESDHPALITDGRQIMVSWSAGDTRHRLIPLP